MQRKAEVFRYAIVGGLTTLVGYGSFWVMAYPIALEANVSNFLSINLAIVFAYWANRFFVFISPNKGIRGVIKEFLAFYSARGLTIVVELLGVFVLTTLLKADPMVSKLAVSVLVVVLNYFISKYWVFRKVS